MNAIDTNIWIYCHDSRDSEKQQVAQRLIETTGRIALLWQVGCEFIAAARKLQPFGFTEEQAWQSLEDMQAMADAVLLPAPELWAQFAPSNITKARRTCSKANRRDSNRPRSPDGKPRGTFR
jgi:predicted nucleic acid-binding protein